MPGSTPDRRRSSVHHERPAPAAMSRFCSTVRCSKTLAVWNVRPTPSRAIWCTFLPSSSAPDLFTDPVAPTSPVIASMTVVLPAPLGPIRKRKSPWNSVRSTSLTALNPSKSTVRPRTSRYSVPMPTLPPASGSSSVVMRGHPPFRARDPDPGQVRVRVRHPLRGGVGGRTGRPGRPGRRGGSRRPR